MSQPKRTKTELRGLLIGMILGDGSLSAASSKQNSRFSVGHSILQKDYCRHKLNLLTSLFKINSSIKERKVLNKKTNKHYPIVQGNTSAHRYFTKLRKLLYSEQGKKGLIAKTLNYLTPEGLAYWYMDDGGIIAPHSKQKIEGCFLSTQCFSYEEHILIKDHFKSKWDIHCSIVSHGKGKFRIKINKTNTIKFFNLIDKYKLPELKHKFVTNYKDYIELKPRSF